MTLWDWAVAAYATPGAADACLDLQDAAGQSVPLLLWAGWSAAEGRPLDEDVIDAACDTARVWGDVAIAPLRTIRRAMKVTRPDMDDVAREAVRDQVKAVELEAERRLLEALEALSPAPAGAPRPLLQALIAVSRAWSERTPRPLLERLAQRLPA